MQGIIVENISNLYRIKEENIEEETGRVNIYEATARGKLKKQAITPVVGDEVEFEVTDRENRKAVITQIKDRKVYIKRPKIANITQIILVISSKAPKPDLLLLDKQLAHAELLNVKSIIVLNKIDLDEKREFENIKQIYEKIGYKVIETNAKEGIGIENLKQAMKNEINAFSGNSGVGKSTLINRIFKREMTEEGEISQKNKRGKNTTTKVKLYEIDHNTFVADSPGFSTFEIEEIQSNQLDKNFKEFKDKIARCEFVGCTHIKEEKCGIKEAIQSGKVSKERYERFCKIYEELKEKEKRKKW